MSQERYEFKPYDILQSKTEADPRWLDFSSLRTQEEADLAMLYVDNDGHAGFKGRFRIVRDARRQVVYPVKPVITCGMGHETLTQACNECDVMLIQAMGGEIPKELTRWQEANRE